MAHAFLRRVKHVARALQGRDLLRRPEVRLRSLHVGSDYGGWPVLPDRLGPESVVYSFGVGEDVSFDLALIARFGVRVHAFDPTPRSRAWIERQALPERFTFHPVGIAAHDGTARFHAPTIQDHVSYSVLDEAHVQGETVEAPVRRLATLADELGHERVDVLKLDVEGAEYEVLDDLMDADVAIGQLLIEFHHRFASVGLQATRDALRLLHARGWRIFAVSPSGEEYGFVQTGA